jgi:hypothetical protein
MSDRPQAQLAFFGPALAALWITFWLKNPLRPFAGLSTPDGLFQAFQWLSGTLSLVFVGLLARWVHQCLTLCEDKEAQARQVARLEGVPRHTLDDYLSIPADLTADPDEIFEISFPHLTRRLLVVAAATGVSLLGLPMWGIAWTEGTWVDLVGLMLTVLGGAYLLMAWGRHVFAGIRKDEELGVFALMEQGAFFAMMMVGFWSLYWLQNPFRAFDGLTAAAVFQLAGQWLAGAFAVGAAVLLARRIRRLLSLLLERIKDASLSDPDRDDSDPSVVEVRYVLSALALLLATPLVLSALGLPMWGIAWTEATWVNTAGILVSIAPWVVWLGLFAYVVLLRQHSGHDSDDTTCR